MSERERASSLGRVSFQSALGEQAQLTLQLRSPHIDHIPFCAQDAEGTEAGHPDCEGKYELGREPGP